jgi:hypothetical protein
MGRRADRRAHRRILIRRAVAVSAVAALAAAGGTAACTVQATQAGAGKSPARTGAGAGAGAGAGLASEADRADAKAAKPAESANSASPATPAAKTPARPKAFANALLMASGAKGEQVRELQARLRELALFDRNPTGYYGPITTAAVKSFQAGHGIARTGTVDIRTWNTLRALTKQPPPSALHPPTSKPLAKPDPRCLSGRVLCISKSSDTLAWMIDGKVISAMDVRFGSQYTPTREGTFSVYFKSRDHFSTIYKTPMPYALFFSGGQAVHYSADFAARGYTGASHGCVNVRDEAKVASLFAQTRIGDKVVIYR